MTLKMTTAQVVETSVTVTNSSFQNYTHPDDHTTRTTEINQLSPPSAQHKLGLLLVAQAHSRPQGLRRVSRSPKTRRRTQSRTQSFSGSLSAVDHRESLWENNLDPRVLRLFCQRLVAWRDSGEID